MVTYPYPQNDFLNKVIDLIEENLSDENFSVEDLAEKLAMSRSNLLRKVKSMTGLSVSVLIREIRLFNAREYLQDESYSVSEIAYKVGFNSTSYFTKCYREQFGYPPGEEGQHQQNEQLEKDEVDEETSPLGTHEYDIFISYRQNNNQDGWVSGFVNALQRELKAILKDEVNIYFDENPHDGLAEHHEVDASLKDKLNSLIFIPILSQTYCDEDGFAWQHEYKSFLKIAGNDQFGLKTKLADGNVASRVLPVRIHDLDKKDVALFESALGSPLRSIDFVYKEIGVNRPLRPDDDRSQNQEKTDYRNQVNKVGNAVRDILASLKDDFVPGTSMLAEEPKLTDAKTSYRKPVKKQTMLAFAGLVLIAILAGVYFIPRFSTIGADDENLEKTIAVLPFKNDSNDSTNVYLMNGVLEAVLDRLQKIEDMEVTSRTTVEKYRQVIKTIPELSEELDVNYFVEGSGQKLGDQILLTVQLIQARKDAQIWSKRYKREVTDIFALQIEIAKDIASEIEAVITPEEVEMIEEVPTDNLVAYDYFLQGKEESQKETLDGLVKAIDLFDKAIAEDDEFANPYAYKAICYFFLELFQAEKKYSDEINTNADKALLLNNTLPESLIAKGLFYMQDKQFSLAVEYFEQALEINPSSGWIHNILSEMYATSIPDTEKYLEHALRGLKTAVAGQDSNAVSFTYLHLANALVQNGFIDESETYILKSLDYNPQNIFSDYVYTYIKLAQNFNLERAKSELELTLAKDTTRLDVIQELAKVLYTMRDYEAAWHYYEKFTWIKETYNLDLFASEDIKIAYVLLQLGKNEEAQKYLDRYRLYAEYDKSQYQQLSLSAYYATMGQIDEGMSALKKFSEEESFQYWFILFLDKDPILTEMAGHPEFKITAKKIEDKFWARNKSLRKMLEEEGIELN